MQTTSIDQRAGELMTIALSLLVPSPRNVRKTNGMDVGDLKASIEAQGVLQNLIVCPQLTKRGKPTGRYEVVGGKRRLKALNELAGEGKISADEEILCRVKPDRDAAEASLAENLHREPMHPADEFEGFQRLVEEGRSVEEIASRFGTSPITVRRRLKLASLHPTLIQLYRDDGITLEQLMALAVSDDADEQLRAWQAAPSWRRDPEFLRQALVAEEVDAAHDALARLVGIEAYEAASGAVRRDLFSDEGGGYLQDAALLNRLASERLEAAAEAVRAEGWSWVDVVLRGSTVDLYRFGRCAKQRRDMTKAEAKEQKALSKQLAALEARSEEDDGDDAEASERLEHEIEAVRERLQRLEEGLSSFGSDAFEAGGALVCAGRDGRIEVHRGLIRPEDRKRAARNADGDAGKGSEPSDEPGIRPAHSAALMLELTAHRTLAARAAMLDQPQVALTALLHCLVQRLLYEGYDVPRSAVRLVPNAPDAGLVPKGASGIGESRAMQVLIDAKQRWGERIPGEPDRLFGWLAALPDSERMDVLALCVALTLNDVRDSERAGSLEAVSTALALDMADWWQPTSDGYFSRVTKETILAAIEEGAGAEAARRIKGVSKGELARVAERELQGTRWLPRPLKPAEDETAG
jgi:ParB family chromosome partitioning protein